MNNNTYIAIMAGGIGSRFWPASTEESPKQFLDILGTGKSLLRSTYERFLKLVPSENILIVTNKKYKDLCHQHVPEIPLSNILCEPSRNNTAPSVAYTALKIQAMNPDAAFVMAPSDHVILKEEEFIQKVKKGLDFLESEEAILTLGISPSRPDTGYGYIEMLPGEGEVRKVNQFKEKPDLAKANEYLAQGNYVWNAGIFIWKASEILASFKKNASEVYKVLTEDVSQYNTPTEQDYIDRVYPNTPNISVDYAILEKADNVYTIPAEIGWSDLGTWGSLHSYLDKDDEDNIIQVKGHQNIEVKDTLVRIDGDKTVVIKGLKDYIVIDNKDALLVFPKNEEQEIKEIVKKISFKEPS